MFLKMSLADAWRTNYMRQGWKQRHQFSGYCNNTDGKLCWLDPEGGSAVMGNDKMLVVL